MRIHVEALFTHDASARLVRVNEPDGAVAPRFFLGTTAEGFVRRYRHDVDDDTRQALEDVSAGEPPWVPGGTAGASPNVERYRAILAQSAPVERIWMGPVFAFPKDFTALGGVVLVTLDNAHMLQPLLASWSPDVTLSAPLFAFVADGRAVSVCCSVRRTSEAHEAGVETSPAYRGRGYAARVVSAWAGAARELGTEPLYSTSWGNSASRALAARIGLTLFGSDLHFT